MSVPLQGLRHAATLLLTNSARAIAVDASPETVRAALERLAQELVALARDMRAPAAAAEWLIAEFNATIDRLPPSFDRGAAKAASSAILTRLGVGAVPAEARDLFLIYVPEDRLPVAAPLAIELTKRRITVAFAEYEVATAEQFAGAVSRGLAQHCAGVVLLTGAFERTRWDLPSEDSRLRLLQHPAHTDIVDELAAWANHVRLSRM